MGDTKTSLISKSDISESEFLSKIGYSKFDGWMCKNCILNIVIENLSDRGDLAYLREMGRA